MSSLSSASERRAQVYKYGTDWRKNNNYSYDNFMRGSSGPLLKFGGSGDTRSYTSGSSLVDNRKTALERAEAGDPGGMYTLGWCYMKGDCEGITKNEATAAEWLKKSADAGFFWGIVNYADMLANGVGVAMDDDAAMEYLQKGYKLQPNDTQLNLSLGYQYQVGSLKNRDLKKALEYFTKAQPDPRAWANLGIMYAFGEGVPVDEKKGAELLKKASDAGNMQARAYYAGMIDGGALTIPQDHDLAVKLYKEAAAAGQTVALYNAAILIRDGKYGGEPVDDAKMLDYFTRAANEGYPAAQYELANAYSQGRLGLTKDHEKAVELAKKAAEKDFISALDLLAVYYMDKRQPAVAKEYLDRAMKNPNPQTWLIQAQGFEYGLLGKPADVKGSRSFYEKAAELNDREANYRLGLAHYTADMGYKKDFKKFREFMRKAAEKKDYRGIEKMGMAWEYGIGGPKDLQKAIAHYREASELGSNLATQALARLKVQ